MSASSISLRSRKARTSATVRSRREMARYASVTALS